MRDIKIRLVAGILLFCLFPLVVNGQSSPEEKRATIEGTKQRILKANYPQLCDMLSEATNSWLNSNGIDEDHFQNVRQVVQDWQTAISNEEDESMIYKHDLWLLGHSQRANFIEFLQACIWLRKLTVDNKFQHQVEGECLKSFTNQPMDERWRKIMLNALEAKMTVRTEKVKQEVHEELEREVQEYTTSNK